MLSGVLQAPDYFRNLWEAKNAADRQKMDTFISVIECRSLLSKVEDVHKVFRVLRSYLWEFDSNDSRRSDVVPKTIDLGLALEQVPVTEFLRQRQKEEILRTF